MKGNVCTKKLEVIEYTSNFFHFNKYNKLSVTERTLCSTLAYQRILLTYKMRKNLRFF